MKYFYLLAFILFATTANAQRLVGHSTYNHDSTGYYFSDSSTVHYLPANTTPTTQMIDASNVAYKFDSMRTYSGSQMMLSAIEKNSYDASYTKMVEYNGDTYSAGVHTYHYNIQYYYTGNVPDSTVYTNTDIVNNATYVAERDYHHVNAQNQVDTSWYNYLNNVGLYLNSSKYANIYNGNNLVEVWAYSSTDSVNYTLTGKTVYFYNPNNTQDSLVGYAWQAGNWYKMSKVAYEYNANQYTIAKQNWFFDNNLQVYVSAGRDQIMRKPDNTRDTLFGQLWLANPGVFDTTVKYASQYQGGLLIHAYAYSKNPNTLQWQPDPYNAIRNFYYDMIPNHVNDLTQEKGLTLYPNPVETVLRFKENVSGHKYSIVSSEGRFMQSGIFDQQQNLNIQNLRNGVYILLTEGNGKTTKTVFIKQ